MSACSCVGCQLAYTVHWDQKIGLPVTLARRQAVLKIVNGITRTLALSTLGKHQYKLRQCHAS